MRQTLPDGEGGPLLFPVMRVNKKEHSDSDIVESVEIARELGMAGVFIADATNDKSTKYVDHVLDITQQANPGFAVGVNYRQYKGPVAALAHVRGSLATGVYSEEPLLWVDEASAGMGSGADPEKLLTIAKSPDLFTATVPTIFGGVSSADVSITGQSQVCEYLDVAVAGSSKSKQPTAIKDVSHMQTAVEIPVAVAGITSRQHVIAYGDADYLIITSGLEYRPGSAHFDRMLLRGFAASAKRVQKERTEQKGGSGA